MKLDLSGALVESISTRSDGSLKIVLGTQELGDDEMKALFAAYAKKKIENSDALVGVTIDEPENGETKSMSQRLRGVLYKIYEGQLEAYRKRYPFEVFYRGKMERIIEQLKEQIS